MKNITAAHIKAAIDAFLLAQFNKKTEKEQKQLNQVEPNSDKAIALQQHIQTVKEKFSKANWLQEAKGMAQNIKMGTHISRGVHSSSRGDNVIFNQEVHHHYVNTQTVQSRLLDANSLRGAIDLPVVSFFEWQVSDDVRIRDLILAQHAELTACFDDDLTVSDEIQTAFYECLNKQLNQASSHERNKQILFPLENQQYITLVPLYPSVLMYECNQKINSLRFSDDNKTARENRYKKPDIQQTAYVSFNDLAVIKLVQTQPQNVSQLVSKMSGRNLLLPSLPPEFSATNLSFSQSSKSIFNSKGFNYRMYVILQEIYEVVKAIKNNVEIREQRKHSIDKLLVEIFNIAQTIQETYPAGWSKKFKQLNMAEKYWLDPYRADLDGEEEFKASRENINWQEKIEESFAHWLQNKFKERFKKIAQDFGKPEWEEWKNEMHDAIKQSQLLKQGIF